MNLILRIEHGASSGRPGDPADAEELIVLANKLDVTVIVQINGQADMFAVPGDNPHEVIQRWEDALACWHASNDAAEKKPPTTTPSYRRLVSPICANCKHADQHTLSAGQDNCKHDGCDCEHYVAEFDLYHPSHGVTVWFKGSSQEYTLFQDGKVRAGVALPPYGPGEER